MRKSLKSAAMATMAALAAACLTACASGPRPAPLRAVGTMRPYQVGGAWYRPVYQPHYDEKGLASWYGAQSRYHTTADGEAFDARIASAAHRTLPLPCLVEVTNLDNGRRVRLRVNDRGPFRADRIIDVSRKGADELGFVGRGVARVRVRYIGPASAASAYAQAVGPQETPY
jgi:rare lipoprotein A